MNQLELSHHALEQARRRHLSETDIRFVVEYAKKERRTGVIFYQMYKKNLPDELAPNDHRRKLEGTTVITCKCGQFVITVYKNSEAFKQDRKKVKYDCRGDGTTTCPHCQMH